MCILSKSWQLRNFIFLVLVTNLFSCSVTDNFNINGYLVRKDQEDNFSTLVARAEHHYDLKEYDLALDFGEKALRLSPGSEKAAVVVGYILLGLSGLDSFELAKGLAQKSGNSSKLANTPGSTAIFDKFRVLLGISGNDTKTIGDLSESPLDLFISIDEFVPYTVTSARNLYNLNILRLVNRAIELICPFVDEGAKNPFDDRHSESRCHQTSRVRTRSVDAHFVWAFTHFAEAVVYYSSVQFTEENQEKTNLDRRVEALETKGSDLSSSDYVEHVQEIQSNVGEIFNFDDPDSQARALLTSLTTVSLAFSRLPGIPKTFTESIQKTLGYLKSAEGEVDGSGNDKSYKSLQSKLNESISKNLSAQISKKIANNEVSDSEKADLCNSYKKISAGAGSAPEGC